MTTILKRLRPLLFLTLFSFLACEEEYVDFNGQAGGSNGTSRIITLEELKAMPKAYEKIMEVMERQQASRDYAHNGFQFWVNTDEILFYKDGTNESLTFETVASPERPYLENLVLNKELTARTVCTTPYIILLKPKKKI
jgi:hypothetical protein